MTQALTLESDITWTQSVEKRLWSIKAEALVLATGFWAQQKCIGAEMNFIITVFVICNT